MNTLSTPLSTYQPYIKKLWLFFLNNDPSIGKLSGEITSYLISFLTKVEQNNYGKEMNESTCEQIIMTAYWNVSKKYELVSIQKSLLKNGFNVDNELIHLNKQFENRTENDKKYFRRQSSVFTKLSQVSIDYVDICLHEAEFWIHKQLFTVGLMDVKMDTRKIREELLLLFPVATTIVDIHMVYDSLLCIMIGDENYSAFIQDPKSKTSLIIRDIVPFLQE